MDKIWLKEYQEGVPAEINPDAYPSLVAFFEHCCAKFADKRALSNFGSYLHYHELADLSLVFATFLQQELGLKKGDRFAIMLPNIFQYYVALFGALRAGLIIVNINPLYTAYEVAHQVSDAGAETVIVMANFAHTIQDALPHSPIKNVIVTQLGDLFPFPKSFLINFTLKYLKRKVPSYSIARVIQFKKALARGRKLHFNPVMLVGEDAAFFQYTGGTTGVPKAAILSHRNMVANIEQVTAWVKPVLVEGREIVITPLPLYHVFSLTANGLTLLHFGALNVLITNPHDIPRFVAELKKFPFSVITGVNTLFNALLNNIDFTKLDFSQLKISLGGGAALQKVVVERWQTITGKVLYEGYGLTEASPVVSIMPFRSKRKNDSIGLPVPSTEISIRDDSGREVGIGETGQLCVKGPQVMGGYWNNPEDTNKAFSDDGWLMTGDVARMDEEGYLYLVDRKKDVILVSGFNVYPNEIEDVLASHPGVFEAAVIGVPDAKTGEAVKAFIVRRQPKLSADDLLNYCHERLTKYKIPKYIEFRKDLPKTSIGKVSRKELRDETS